MNSKLFFTSHFDYPEITVSINFVELRRTIPPPPDDHYQEVSTEERVLYTHGEFADLFRQNQHLKPVVEYLKENNLISSEPRNSKTSFGLLVAKQLSITVENGKILTIEKNGYKSIYLYTCYTKQSLLSSMHFFCLNTEPLKAIFPDHDCFIDWFSKQNNESFEFDNLGISNRQISIFTISPNAHSEEDLEPLSLGLIEQHVKSYYGAYLDREQLALKEFATALGHIPDVHSAVCKLIPKGNKGVVFNFQVLVTRSFKEDEIQLDKLINVRPPSLYKKDDVKIKLVDDESQFDKGARHFYQAEFSILYQKIFVADNTIHVNCVTNDQVIIKKSISPLQVPYEFSEERFTWYEYLNKQMSDDISLYLETLQLDRSKAK
ncbi:MAG: hypothetical protein JSU09_00240 [Bacteroidetes bacterium]|nr:hypothetical protein [Bacteroidota bacterium]